MAMDFSSLGGPGIGTSPGQCPLTPQGDCTYGGDTVSCTLIRECDNYFGTNHFEYANPGGPSKNVNIWQVDPATGKQQWIGQSGNPERPPNGATAPVVGGDGSYAQYNVEQVGRISKLIGVPAGTPLQYNPMAGYVLSGGALAEPSTKQVGLTGGMPKGTQAEKTVSGAAVGNLPGKPAPPETKPGMGSNTPYILLGVVALIWYLN